MDDDTSAENQVAALNVHHIISRAAGMGDPAPDRRKNGRTRTESTTKSGAGRPPKAK
jgi:hypothetical protein